MQLTTTAFEHNGPVPARFSGDGEDLSPPLSWSGLPGGTKALALICDDPDAPTPQPFVHWLIWNIPAEAGGLPEGVPTRPRITDPVEASQGGNSFGNTGYGGPAPPPGHGTHHYHFKLYALDAALNLEPGSGKDELLEAMEDHVLDQVTLTGTYER